MIRPPSFGKGLNIADTAEDLLAHVTAHYEAATPGSVTPLPARRVVLPGDPREVAWDCEQLTVCLEGIGFGPAVDAAPTPSPRTGAPISATALRHAVLAVSLVRCTPAPGNDGEAPPDEELNAAGLTFLRDCGMLSQCMVTFAGLLRDQLGVPPSDGSVQCGAVTPFGPSGGYHAADVAIAITVPELV